MAQGLAGPRTILAMGGNDHPFLAQRMPSLFPNHGSLQFRKSSKLND
jgi:hypothetical protein